jgi:hypothetical protein
MKRLIFLLVSLSMSMSVSVSISMSMSMSMSMPTSRTWSRTWKRMLTETGTRTGMGHGQGLDHHSDEATLSIDVEKMETMKRLFCLQDMTLKRWSDIIASKCLILKRSSDNFASKIQNVQWSDNARSSDHDRKIALSELRPPLIRS